MKPVALILGSDSDWPIVKKAALTLRELEIPFEAHILSAHRTPEQAAAFAKGAREAGFGVLIAAAGLAAHLAGALAAGSILPVIGIPMASGGLGGLDALLSTVQMPSGVPVATVGVGNAANAALLAAEILALGDDALAERLIALRAKNAAAVAEKEKKLQLELGELA